MTAALIADVLGGHKSLRVHIQNEPELVTLTRKGFPVGALTSMAKELKLPVTAVAKVVGITERTLSRRIAEKGRLSAHESDRLVRLARVFAHAVDVLESGESASKWLQIPNRALGGDVPLELLDTDTGAAQVDVILGRIEYGIFS